MISPALLKQVKVLQAQMQSTTELVEAELPSMSKGQAVSFGTVAWMNRHMQPRFDRMIALASADGPAPADPHPERTYHRGKRKPK